MRPKHSSQNSKHILVLIYDSYNAYQEEEDDTEEHEITYHRFGILIFDNKANIKVIKGQP